MARLRTIKMLGVALLLAPASARAEQGSADETGQPSASVGLAGHRFQQVALTTADLPRAISFYRDILGLPLLFESNNMAFFDVAGIRLMIALDANRPSARPTSILYFDAPDFVTTLSRLNASAVEREGPVETVQRTERGELRLQQFRDPDGNALAIMGTVPTR